MRPRSNARGGFTSPSNASESANELQVQPNQRHCAPGCRRRCRRPTHSYHSNRCAAPKRSDFEASANRSPHRRAGERSKAPQLRGPLRPSTRAILPRPNDFAVAPDREPHECRRAERADLPRRRPERERPRCPRTRSTSIGLRQAGSFCSWKDALSGALNAELRALAANGGERRARESFRLLFGRNSIPRGLALRFQRAPVTPPVGRNLPLFLAGSPS